MSLSVLKLIMDAGFLVKIVLIILLGFSVLSWAIIFKKYRALRKAKKDSAKFLEIFWNSRRLDTVYESAKQLTYSPLAEVFKAGYIELINIKSAKSKKQEGSEQEVYYSELGGIDNVSRALRRASLQEVTNLEKLVSFLATTGNTAPFIGLFGTVWGIMTSFLHIGQTKDTSLAVVAPGISEALIATAMGLLAAIPAVVFYNLFVSHIRVLSNEMDNFASDFINIIKRHFF